MGIHDLDESIVTQQAQEEETAEEHYDECEFCEGRGIIYYDEHDKFGAIIGIGTESIDCFCK